MKHRDQMIMLFENTWFREVIDEILENEPAIPAFDPNNLNTELWKKESGRKEGFQLFYELLQPSNGGNNNARRSDE